MWSASVRLIEAVAVHDAGAGRLTVFAVNRAARPLVLEADVRGFAGLVVEEHRVLTGSDLRLSNTASNPLRVVPSAGRGAAVDGRRLVVQLRPHSWNVVRTFVT